MFRYMISGHTYECKDELKSILPDYKDMKSRRWTFCKQNKAWLLEVQHAINTPELNRKIRKFCKEHKLRLVIVEEIHNNCY